jgi:HlyD family secretion protein
MPTTPTVSRAPSQESRMDKPIAPEILRRRQHRRWRMGLAAAGVLALIAWGVSRLKPAAPLVEKSTVWIDTVKRGEMLRQVRGNGTLVPEEIRWIPAMNAGRVERILVLPGAAVKPDTVLVELSDPQLEQDVFEAESQVKGAQADLANLKVQLASEKLTQQAGVATAQADYTTAKAESDINEALGKTGLVAAVTVIESKAKTEELSKLLDIEKERLTMTDESAKAQTAAENEKIAQLQGLLDLKQRLVEGLKIKAGMEGVLQRLGDDNATLQEGQQLSAGAPVARVASQTKLKAEIKVAETEARDVQLNQSAEIDTRNGIIPGHVVRIDPAVENGTVTVDVSLDGSLPKGARPDLSVDGTIQLELLANVLYVGRPVQGQPDGKLDLFKVVDNGRTAMRVPVGLGRSSVSTIEITGGLHAGDQVILSDMANWDQYERIRLE